MKKLNRILILLTSLAFVLCMTTVISASGGSKKLHKVAGTPNYTKLNINNISTYIRNNGDSDLDNNNQAGFEFPKRSSKKCFFESGFVWGATVNGNASDVRVGGSTYNAGMQPGKILSPGVAEDPNLDKNRIYRVRSSR